MQRPKNKSFSAANSEILSKAQLLLDKAHLLD